MLNEMIEAACAAHWNYGLVYGQRTWDQTVHVGHPEVPDLRLAMKAALTAVDIPTQELLERAQRAEAAAQEAVAREAVLVRIVESAECIVADQEDNYEWKAQDTCEWAVLTNALSELRQRPEDDSITAATAALLERLAGLEAEAREAIAQKEGDEGLVLSEAIRICERRLANPPQAVTILLLLEQLAELEAQVADLRGALRAALLSLEAAADALVPEARVAEAAALVDEAMAAIREELE